MDPKYGIHYKVQPEPMDPAACTSFDAGAVQLILEYRSLDPESLARSYADRPEDLAEILRLSPEGGFTDAGVSIHVVAAKDGHEYLRFDVFKGDPHYHYVHPTNDCNHWVPFDPIAGGDMFTFAMTCLRERLDPLIERHDERGRFVGPDDPGRVRIERDDERQRHALACLTNHALDDLQMAAVQAVEIPERHDRRTIPEVRGITGKSDDAHRQGQA